MILAIPRYIPLTHLGIRPTSTQPIKPMRISYSLLAGLLSFAVVSTPVAQPIPDNDPGGITSTQASVDTGIIVDLDIGVNITHTWVGDLIITLEHVDTGTTAVLMDRPGVPADPFGCSEDNVDATFDDGGSDGPVEDMCSPDPPAAIFGSPVPEEALSIFSGEDAGGDWSLTVSDNAEDDTGTLDSWTLIFTIGVANEPVAPEQMPDGFVLEQAYPNPFNPSATIGFAVADAQEVRLELYDALGRQARSLFVGTIPANVRQEVQIDAGGLPSGIYLVRLQGSSFSATRRVTLLK